MTGRDCRRMAEHLGLAEAELEARYLERRDGKLGLRSRGDGFCMFFDQGCGVHPARPDVCRAWPFFRGNLVDSSSWEMIQDYCPGVNAALGHAEFARQGRKYLREQGLLREGAEGAPNALLPDSRSGKRRP